MPEPSMQPVEILLVLATLLCSLVAGFLFAFAVVAMPGIGRLEDGPFLRAFQEMDGIIQRGQPLFGLVWIGSVAALLGATALGIAQLSGVDRTLLAVAASTYLLGAQLPTVMVNIPLNNEVQALVISEMHDAALLSARDRFERRWNRWNATRTVCAIVASAILLTLVQRL